MPFFSEGYTTSDNSMRYIDSYAKYFWRYYNFYKGEKISAHLNIFFVSLIIFFPWLNYLDYAWITKGYLFGNKQEQIFYPGRDVEIIKLSTPYAEEIVAEKTTDKINNTTEKN